jgi:integral membrane protein
VDKQSTLPNLIYPISLQNATATMEKRSGIRLLQITGWLEGISYLILIGIAMPLKYIAHKPEAVKIVGMVHGILFVAYVIILLVIAYRLKWEMKKISLAFLAAFIPFGTFWADYSLFRKVE